MRKCGAKTKAGGKCQYHAGQGTDHYGAGKCKLHGGASNGAPKGNKNALKHGIYSRIFAHEELDQAKDMQGSIEIELAITRLQLVSLLKKQKTEEDQPRLDKVEEKTTIVQDDKPIANTLERMEESAQACGENYSSDGDEDYIFNEDDESLKESAVFERKRTFLRRDFSYEFIRLTALIARLELQLISSSKTRVEIELIKRGDNQTDDVEQFTDLELDQAIQSAIEGLTI